MSDTADLPDYPHDCAHRFHQAWGHLSNPHVRSLAWLLSAPDLLSHTAEKWQGRIASLADVISEQELNPFLDALDRDPSALLKMLDIDRHVRLGRYAESLMAFYLRAQGVLVAHGVAVRTTEKKTVGEFDFLLRIRGQLVHWEFATKFYLLEASGRGQSVDYFVGPNLADTLGAKMDKIFGRQLHLSSHPAAQQVLTEPVAYAQALVKGWLFYRRQEMTNPSIDGLSMAHCRGFWCKAGEWHSIMSVPAMRYVILPRLAWLAPACLKSDETLSHAQIQAHLDLYFDLNDMPLMVALMQVQGAYAYEVERGFVVRDDWQQRASHRMECTKLQAI